MSFGKPLRTHDRVPVGDVKAGDADFVEGRHGGQLWQALRVEIASARNLPALTCSSTGGSVSKFIVTWPAKQIANGLAAALVRDVQ